jgi:molybdopterin converting factor small subunit
MKWLKRKTMITIDMRLFGAFRAYGETIRLQVPAGSPVTTVKQALGNALGTQARDLVADSVVANDETILPADYVIAENTELSILPPVCGG